MKTTFVWESLFVRPHRMGKRLVLPGLAMLLLPLSGARGQAVWDGDTSGSWSAMANWAGNTLPAFGAGLAVQFHQAGAGNLDTFIGGTSANRDLGSLTFTSEVDSAVRVRLYSNGSGTGGNNRNLNFLSLSGPVSINVQSGAAGDITLGVSGGVLNLGAHLEIHHEGSGNLLINRPINELSGPFSVTKNGAGTLTLAANHTFSGGFVMNGGRVRVGDNGALGSGGVVTLNGGSLSGDDNVTAREIARNLEFGGPVVLGDATDSAALTFAGTVDLGGVERSLTVASEVTFSNTVSDGGLNKLGAGRLTLSGVNDYTGVTTINEGTLRLTQGSTPGGTAGGTVVNAGGTLELGGTLVGGEALTLNGTGRLAASGDNGWAGPVTVSNSVFDIAGGTTVLTGQVTGTGGITKLGAGTLELGDPAGPTLPVNDFQGVVVVEAGVLRLDRGSPNSAIPESAGTNPPVAPLPDGAAIQINGGTLALGRSHQIGDTRGLVLNGGVFDLQGHDETLGLLTLTASSVIDLGDGLGGVGSLVFSGAGSVWSGSLSIWNYDGALFSGLGATGGVILPGLTASQLAQIQFYSDGGVTLLGSEAGDAGGVIVPVPEPSAALSALLLLGAIGWRERGMVLRRRRES